MTYMQRVPPPMRSNGPRIALIICVTVVVIVTICCGGLLLLGAVMPPSVTIPTPAPGISTSAPVAR